MPNFDIKIRNLMAIMVLMLINLMFFTTRMTKLFVLNKMGKSMDLANFATVTDASMFTLGILTFMWALNLRSNFIDIVEIQN